MTSRSTLAAALALAFTFGALGDAEAAKADKKNRRAGAGSPERFLSRFDRNNDQKLDAAESEHVRQAFESLKKLDTDKDGSLSESEVAAAKVAQKRARKKKTE